MVFDLMAIDKEQQGLPFKERYEILKRLVQESHKRHGSWVQLVEQKPIHSVNELYQFYQKIVRSGGEGVVLRNPDTEYEHRRTRNLIKFKPVLDKEAKVIDYTEGKGSFKNMLGTFKVEITGDDGEPKTFQLSGRMNREFRSAYQFRNGKISQAPRKGNSNHFPVIGDMVTYEYMSLSKNGIPRQPIFLRLRNAE